MKYDFDIDIDLSDRSELLDKIPHVVATIERESGIDKHNTGVYLQDIPANPVTGLSNIDHKVAQTLGYFKIDFLNVSIYDDIVDESELIELMDTEPVWELLGSEEIVEQLFHISSYFWLVDKFKPASIDQLAMVLAMIRPAKRYLAKCKWSKIEREIWNTPTDGSYFFKKSHAYSYAVAIVVQLNTITKALLAT